MEFSKLSSPSLKDLFVREIENMILSGKLNVGDKIPPERELSEKMSVSRTVINSGLAELARIGFIEIHPRIGAYVADFHRKGTIETLNAILKYKGGILTNAEMKSLLEIRMVMENLAIELAIPLLTEKRMDQLKILLDNFSAARGASESAECIFLFHHELCILSENSLLPVVFYSFRELSVCMWERYFSLHGKEDLLENTEELFINLKNRDRKAALGTFQLSLKKTIEGVVSIYH